MNSLGAAAWLGVWWIATISAVGVTLEYAPAPADNPLKGFVPYLGERPGFPHSMEWDYTALSEVMKGPREFDWAPFEAKLAAAASRGHHFYARFYLEWPGRPSGVPQFLIEEGLTLRRWTNTNTQPWPPAIDHTPDYEDPRLRAALTNFIRAFGARYDGDPRLGFIGLGLLGTWGEWHNHPKNEWFASPTVQREVLDAYEAAFRQTRLLARYPVGPGDSRYADNHQRRVGYHDDSFAWATVHTGRPQDEWFFETRLRRAGALDKWRIQPIGGEVRPELWDCLFDEPSCAPTGQEFERCVLAVRPSWLAHQGLFRSPLDPEVKRRAVRAAQRLGYELHVTDAAGTVVSRDGTLLVALTVTNTGVAPFYYAWPVELGAIDGLGRIVDRWPTDWTLAGIIPGDPATAWGIRVPIDHLAPGRYQFGLRAPNRLPDGPPVRFANATQDQHVPGWLTLGEFILEPSRKPPPPAEVAPPARVEIQVEMLLITEDHHPFLRQVQPLRGLLAAGAPLAWEPLELRGDELDWLGPSVFHAENVRIQVVTGPGVIGVQPADLGSAVAFASLKAQPGIEVIAVTPMITRSGQVARREATEVITVLTGIHPEALVEPGDQPRDLTDPYTAVSMPVGLLLEVLSEVDSDSDTMDLTLSVTLAEFVGYDPVPVRRQVEVWQRGEAVRIDPPAPRLLLREVTGLARLSDGDTMVLGSWPAAPAPRSSPRWDLEVEDPPRIPVVLFLVTATLLNEDGSPWRPRDLRPSIPATERP